jgi:hypothetical protein
VRRIILAAAVVGLVLGLVSPALAQDEARAIVEKAIQARGGAEKLEKIKAYQGVSKGTLEVLGMNLSLTAQTAIQYPDRMKSVLEFEVMGQKFTVTQVLNKDKAWIQASAGGQVQDIDVNEDLLKAFKEGVYAEGVGRLVPLLKDPSYTLSSLGEIKINDRPALGVKVSSKGHKDVNIYFDKATGLPSKVENTTINSELRECMQEVFLLEYKDYDGLKRPSKSIIHQDGKKLMELEVTEVKFLDKLDDSEFEKP